jgi:hypothetical protein
MTAVFQIEHQLSLLMDALPARTEAFVDFGVLRALGRELAGYEASRDHPPRTGARRLQIHPVGSGTLGCVLMVRVAPTAA